MHEFESLGAIKHGHFKLSSGRHSDTYIQCATVLARPMLAAKLIEPLVAKMDRVDVVVAPAIGAIVFGYLLAHQLDCRMVFAERVDGKFALRRDFYVSEGERVIIAEDVITTGGSVNEIAGLVKERQGQIIGIASLVDRGEHNGIEYPIYSLLKITPVSYEEAECEMCKRKEPLDHPGSRFI